MLKEPWRAELLGRIVLRSGTEIIDRFRERKIVCLLAMLAVQEHTTQTRAELVERLWPEEDPEVSRNRFRVTLHHLRHMLEPLGVEPGSVLAAGRNEIYLRSAAFTSDVVDMLALLESANRCREPGERAPLLERAAGHYRGEFLPGYEDLWVQGERERLARRHFQALRCLTHDLMVLGDTERALHFAHHAVVYEPLDEETNYDYMRLLALAGQPSEGLRQYEQFCRLLQNELGANPSAVTQKLAALLQARLGHGVRSTGPTQPKAARIESTHRNTRPDTPNPTSVPASDRRPTPEVRRSLPVRLTRFFGRETEVEALMSLLAQDSPTRLVTLLGPGGVGKTRLALETAERLGDRHPYRVVFLGLADIFSVRQIGETLLAEMRLSPAQGMDVLSQALAALQEAPTLLILDNMEHLLPEASDLVGQILSATSSVRCLATSRRSLGIEGEWAYALQPLPLPEQETSLMLWRDYPGVALFLDRARAAKVDFTLVERNAEDILWLCHHLEGLPLALELAAARIRVMSVKEMRQQLADALNWLTDLRGAKEARHRSLRSAIEWSFRLLSPRLRRCFEALAVFVAGFTPEAAAFVCMESRLNKQEILGILEELSQDSLLTSREHQDGTMRFGMLETLRAYGRELLGKSGREAEVCRRHLQWYGSYVAGLKPEDNVYLHLLTEEDANLRAAITYGLGEEAEEEDRATALQMVCDLMDYWAGRGSLSEGREFVIRALTLSQEVRQQVRLRTGAARLAVAQGDLREAHTLSEQGMLLAEQSGDKRGLADSQFNLGQIAFRQGRYQEARHSFFSALSIYEALSDPKQQAACLSALGTVDWYELNHAGARVQMEQALAIFQRLGAKRQCADCLQRIGNIVRDQGDLVNGEILLNEALQGYRNIGYISGIATVLHDLGLIALFRNDFEQGQLYMEEALNLYRRCGMQTGIASCLHNIGEMRLKQNQIESGRQMSMEALLLYRQIGDRRSISATLSNLAVAAALLKRYEEERRLLQEALEIDREIGNIAGSALQMYQLGQWQALHGEPVEGTCYFQQALDVFQKHGYRNNRARTLIGLAPHWLRQGRNRFAVQVTAAAIRYLRDVGFQPYPDEMRFREIVIEQLQTTMEGDAFAILWQEGEQCDLETLLAAGLPPI